MPIGQARSPRIRSRTTRSSRPRSRPAWRRRWTASPPSPSTRSSSRPPAKRRSRRSASRRQAASDRSPTRLGRLAPRRPARRPAAGVASARSPAVASRRAQREARRTRPTLRPLIASPARQQSRDHAQIVDERRALGVGGRQGRHAGSPTDGSSPRRARREHRRHGLPALACDAEVAPEERLGSRRAEGDEHGGGDGFEPASSQRPARGDLAPARLGGSAACRARHEVPTTFGGRRRAAGRSPPPRAPRRGAGRPARRTDVRRDSSLSPGCWADEHHLGAAAPSPKTVCVLRPGHRDRRGSLRRSPGAPPARLALERAARRSLAPWPRRHGSLVRAR